MHARAAVGLLVCLASLAGCLSDADTDTNPPPPPPAADDFMPRVVVAVVDTGIQPYHDEFRQVRAGEDAWAHPSTYLEGYPADAPAIPITLNLNSTEADDHFDADAELWDNTSRETLYWLPGTKIIGLVGFGRDIPGGGHGTMTSGRATGNTISVGGNETLLMHVAVPLAIPLAPGETAEARAVRWTADQEYVDIQSHSWGMFVMCSDLATDEFWGWSEAFKYARDKQLVMVAAANGHGNAGALGYPSQCQSNSGVPGVVTVSATDNEGFARWSNWFPAIAADGCANPAPDEDTTDAIENTGGGTSSATPYSAGGAAKLILEARRILRDPTTGIRDGVVATLHEGGTTPAEGPLSDGEFTLDELKQVLFRTAVAPPVADPSDGDACLGHLPPEAFAAPEAWFPFIGYGEINTDGIAHGVAVLRGEEPLPERPTEDLLYAQDQALRQAIWG